MLMLTKLFLLFLIVPLIEIALLLKIGSYIGIWLTLFIVIGTAVLGASLTHREGLKTWWRLRQKLTSGALPDDELLDGIMILIAGAVLLTPGFLTDAVGFALLYPGTRQIIKNRVRRKFSRSLHVEYREL
jgi:UPF0716 protein FxsA